VAEVPHPREDHRQAVLVGGGDDFRVLLGATRLRHGRRAGAGRLVQAVTEGEEGV